MSSAATATPRSTASSFNSTQIRGTETSTNAASSAQASVALYGAIGGMLAVVVLATAVAVYRIYKRRESGRTHRSQLQQSTEAQAQKHADTKMASGATSTNKTVVSSHASGTPQGPAGKQPQHRDQNKTKQENAGASAATTEAQRQQRQHQEQPTKENEQQGTALDEDGTTSSTNNQAEPSGDASSDKGSEQQAKVAWPWTGVPMATGFGLPPSPDKKMDAQQTPQQQQGSLQHLPAAAGGMAPVSGFPFAFRLGSIPNPKGAGEIPVLLAEPIVTATAAALAVGGVISPSGGGGVGGGKTLERMDSNAEMDSDRRANVVPRSILKKRDSVLLPPPAASSASLAVSDDSSSESDDSDSSEEDIPVRRSSHRRQSSRQRRKQRTKKKARKKAKAARASKSRSHSKVTKATKSGSSGGASSKVVGTSSAVGGAASSGGGGASGGKSGGENVGGGGGENNGGGESNEGGESNAGGENNGDGENNEGDGSAVSSN